MNRSERTFLEDLGQRLRSQREARKLTQAQLAARCGLHRTFIGSVERGERNVSVLNLRLIARVLRVKLADLFSYSPPAGQAWNFGGTGSAEPVVAHADSQFSQDYGWKY